MDILAGLVFLQDAPAPGIEMIHPGSHRVFVAAQLLHCELGTEAIVAERLHRQLVPFRGAVVPVHHDRGYLIVAVSEDVGFNYYRLADGALYRKTPAVDAR